MLDIGVRAFQWLIRATGRGFRPEASVAQVRAGYRELNQRFGFPVARGVRTRSIEIPVAGGTVDAVLHVPESAGPRSAVLLYFHGGGWVIGDAQCYRHLTGHLAAKSGVAVLSVGYRKGPEHRIPVPFEDGFDAYAWLSENGEALGLDAARIAVGGDSAGGSIAAAISAFAADRGLRTPAFQLLIYPPLDGTQRFPSRHSYRNGDMILPTMRGWFAKHALATIEDLSHPYLVLLDAPHPERNPPTYFLAAGYDALVDEGRAYVERLRDVGVPVTYDLRETLPHGLVNIPRVTAEARRAVDAAASALSRVLLR